MRTRNWESLGSPQQNRYIGWGRKQGWSEERTRQYYNEGGSLQRARGKTVNEYSQRKQREQARAGEWWPLRPSQVAHMRKMGALDGDLRAAQEIPQRRLQQLIREQKHNFAGYAKNPKTFKADWTPDEWKNEHPEIPEIFFYYHGSTVWN